MIFASMAALPQVLSRLIRAKMGKRVILIEPGKHLGGISSGGSVIPISAINMQSPDCHVISTEDRKALWKIRTMDI